MNELGPPEQGKSSIDDLSKKILGIETENEISTIKIHIHGKLFLYLELGDRFKIALDVPRAVSAKVWGFVGGITGLALLIIKHFWP
ncbi:MAG: hypothetical protein M0Z81_02855 [Deltaproteobacteria bacterium]|jgi:hypothetical protein|nr:hypothetical protein [Deltaproteobacteria bacterium]